MINSQEFTKRLQKVIEYYGESASSFAEKIGVQRSSISHLLSGRNKPSLEFILKILSAYPEVELYWLINGRGSFPKKSFQKEQEAPAPSLKSNGVINKAQHSKHKKIDRIIIFYSDGSFENFEK